MKIIYFFIFLFLLNNAYGFGISPAEFNLDLRNGEHAERSFYLFNDNNENKVFNISSYNAEFLNFSSFLVEINKKGEAEVYFLIDVPDYFKNGSYEGRIYIQEIEYFVSGINLNTLLGIKINLNVLNNDIRQEYVFEKEDFKADGPSIENDIHNDIIFDEYPKEDLDSVILDRKILLFFALTGFIIILFFSLIFIKIIFRK